MMSKKLIKEITLAVFITASCNLVLALYADYLHQLEIERIYRETGLVICTFGARSESFPRFLIELCLIVALTGSRLKRLGNTVLSIIGLSAAVILYIRWWQIYFRIIEVSGAGPNAIKNFAYLYGGTFVDVAIAAGILVLVVLNVIDAAASSFRLEPDQDSSNGPSQT
jgi:hypothetical protein